MKTITFNMVIEDANLPMFSVHLDDLLSAANTYAYEYDFKLCDSDEADEPITMRYIDNKEVKRNEPKS